MSWSGQVRWLAPVYERKEFQAITTQRLYLIYPGVTPAEAWLSPPGYPTPGLALVDAAGTPLLALSETPSINKNPEPFREFPKRETVDGLPFSATFAVLSPTDGSWQQVARWRVFEDDWTLAELLEPDSATTLDMPPRKGWSGPLLAGSTFNSKPPIAIDDSRVFEDQGEKKPGRLARLKRGLVAPTRWTLTEHGRTGEVSVDKEGLTVHEYWHGKTSVAWSDTPTLHEQVLSLHIAMSWTQSGANAYAQN